MIKKLFVMASFLTMISFLSSDASAYSITIENLDTITDDIGGFTLWLDVGDDFISTDQVYGAAVPAIWGIDNYHNSHFGASDVSYLFTETMTPLQNGTLVSFNYTGTSLLTVDNSTDSTDTPFSLVKFTSYDGVDLFADGTITLKSFNANGATFTAAVPIPGAVWLLGSGLAGLIALRRKSR